MGFNFDMGALTSGTLFHGTALNGLYSATLDITNGATASQSGGQTGMASLCLGTSAGSGAYNLSGGTLSAPSTYIGYSGTGIFTQSGGTNAYGNFLNKGSRMSLGYNPGSNGTYNLIGGSLSAQSIYVGYSGAGAFTQSGGTNAIRTVHTASRPFGYAWVTTPVRPEHTASAARGC